MRETMRSRNSSPDLLRGYITFGRDVAMGKAATARRTELLDSPRASAPVPEPYLRQALRSNEGSETPIVLP